MKKFEVIALFDHAEKKTVVEAMDESEALDKWGIENEFKYDYITKVTEIKKK